MKYAPTACLLFLCALSSAQTFTAPAGLTQLASDPGTCAAGTMYFNITTTRPRVCATTNTWADWARISTVASLPSAASNTNILYLVTDGSTASDCTTGLGSFRVWCGSNGAAWSTAGPAISKTTNVLKGNNAGGAATATPGADYSAPGTSETTTGDRALSGRFDCSACTHSLPAKTGTLATIPLTCTVGELYFATDATAGQQIYECSTSNVWTQQTGGGGGTPSGANGDLQLNNAAVFGPAPLNRNADGSVNASKAVTFAAPSTPTFAAGGTTICDFSQSNECQFTMTGNTTLSVLNPHGGGPYALRITQDGAGGHSITYPGAFQGFCQPSPNSGVVTAISFMYDGSTTTNYYGFSCSSTDSPTAITGPTRTAPAAPPVGVVSEFFSNTANMPQSVDSSGNLNSHVRTAAGATLHQWIDYVSTLGIPHTSQPTAADIGGSLTGDLSGTFASPTVAKVNGTSVPTNAAADQVINTTASATAQWTAMPTCNDSGGNHLNYSTGSHSFSCGNSSGGGSTGVISSVIAPSYIAPIIPLDIKLTTPVTIANTVSTTTLIGKTFLGSSVIPAGNWLGRTFRLRASGVYGTAGIAPTLTVTITVGGVIVATMNPTLSPTTTGQGWEVEYMFSVASMTSINGSGCFRAIGTSTTFLGICSGATTGSLNFATDQALDVQATWGTANAANTITALITTAGII